MPGGYQVHDYGDYQPSKAEVLALRAVRAAAGSRGGAAKQTASKLLSKDSSKNLPSALAKSYPVPVPVPDPIPPSSPSPPPTPTDGARAHERKAQQKAPNGHETVLTAFRGAWAKRHGREPSITAADRSQLGRLLNGARPADIPPARWPARLAALAVQYVGDREKFVVEAGHPLRLLGSRLGALMASDAKAAPVGCAKCGVDLAHVANLQGAAGRVCLGCR